MGIVSFLPIILMVVFILIIVIGIQRFFSFVKMTYRMKDKIFIGYIGVLLLGSIIYFSLIQPKYEAREDTRQDVPDAVDISYNTPTKIHDVSNEWVVEEWEVAVEEKELTLEMYHSSFDGISVPVIVEENKDSEKVHAELYHFPFVFGDRILDEQSVRPDVHVDGQTFVLSFPDEYKEVSFYGVENDMIYQQFSESPRFDDFEIRQNSGQILYLQMPEGTKVHANEELFEIIRLN